MILLIYGKQENLPISVISKYVDQHTEICESREPGRINHELAENREFIRALIIQKGMPETSAMIGECHENNPRIPVIIALGRDIEKLL